MDALRLSLLIVGALVIGGVYLWTSHLKHKRQQQQAGWEGPDSHAIPNIEIDNSDVIIDQDEHGFSAHGEPTIDFDKLYPQDVAKESISFSDTGEFRSLSDVITETATTDVKESTPSVFVKPKVYISKLDKTKSHIKAVHERERLQSRQSNAPKPQGLVIVINLLARPGLEFNGEKIAQALNNAGLELGDMNIFHYFSQSETQAREKIFSLANMVNPGTFDIDNISALKTQGLTLFMQLPGPVDGLIAFEQMLTTAQSLKKELDGELCDETRSALTYQTISHLKEQIKEYSFKYHKE